MESKRFIARQLIASSATLCLASAAVAAEPSATDMVDALNGVFGKHGARASHAKGFCAAGTFTPADGAGTLTQAKLLGAKSVPAQVRFSVGGGNPAASDKSRSVRGLAVRLSGAGETYDLVLISEPVFFAATPASFVSFLQARVPDPATKKPDPAKVEAHNQQFPESKRQLSLVSSHAAPASYGSTAYHSNHAFRFVNKAGNATWARVIVQPVDGARYLTAEEEKSLPDAFLESELKTRLEKGPVEFDVLAQPQGKEDSLTDPTTAWTGESRVALGRLAVTKLTEQSCNQEVFVPTNLPAGIEPADDPILKVRAAAYGVSKARR